MWSKVTSATSLSQRLAFHIVLQLGHSSKLTLVTCPLPTALWTFISAIADHCSLPEATASLSFANLPMRYFLCSIWHWNSALRISINPFLKCLCSQTTNAGVSARCPFCYKMQVGTILLHILRTVRSCIQRSASAFIENCHLTNWLSINYWQVEQGSLPATEKQGLLKIIWCFWTVVAEAMAKCIYHNHRKLFNLAVHLKILLSILSEILFLTFWGQRLHRK